MDVKEDTVADFEWPGLFISIVPRITGSLSVVSSSTIIFLIYRSDAKLTTIYHRIMFCMSICDIIGSTAMTLTTIPMPKEMPLEQELGFEWPGGNRYGNTLSCNIQGFSFTFGTLTMFGLNAMLCFYYACSIAFQMKEINIRKYIQPIIYGIPLAVGLTFATVPLFTDLINPPTNFQKGYWCLPTTYPFGCVDEDTCIRGGKYVNVLEKRAKAMTYVAMVSVLIMVGSLLLVIGRVMRTGCLLRRQGNAEKKQQNNIDDLFQRWEMIDGNDDDKDSDEGDDSFGPKRLPPALSRVGTGQISASAKIKFRKRSLLRSSTFERVSRIQSDTKVVIFQAILYVLAFFGGLAWTFNDDIDVKAFKFGLIFVPSQGFFNLLIFLWHKIYNYKRQHRETPACEVVRLLFTTPVQEACFVSRISLVLDDEFDTEQTMDDMPLRIPPFQIHHEMGDEEIMKMINTCEFEKTKLNSDNMERCGISEGAGDDILEDFPIDSSNANIGNVNHHDYGKTNPQVQEPPLSMKRIYRRRGTLNTSRTSNNTSGTGLTRSTATAHGISDRTIDNKNLFPVSLRASDSSVNGMPGQGPDPGTGTGTDRSYYHRREGNSLHLSAGSGNDNSANNNSNAEYTSSSNDSFLRIRLALLQEEEQMTKSMQDKDTTSSHCEDLSIDGLSGFSAADLSVGVPSSAGIESEIPSALNSAKLSEHQSVHPRTETAIDSEFDSCR